MTKHRGSHFKVKPADIVSAVLWLMGGINRTAPLILDSRQLLYQKSQAVSHKQPGQIATLLAASLSGTC